MRIVMTGATSGIGLETAKCLLRQAGCSLVVAARNPDKAPTILRQRADLQAVDLASLRCVRDFASRLTDQTPIDALVLNAGLQCTTRRVSADGYELTFAVNHLAHYFLIRLLMPHLSQQACIVITSSGTHDPRENTGLPAPRHADVQRLAYPDNDPDIDRSAFKAARRAYASSKLCNVMTAREVAKKNAAIRPALSICAFDPGLTPGTGLARNYFRPAAFVFEHVLPLVARRHPRMSTPAISGRLLAELVNSPDYRALHGDYFAVRGGKLNRTLPSELAQDDVACLSLWADSARLLGLPP
jgi:NAD(P)-dependent dehydrogenase (short-subunit alcohol dehydrogenase family)